MSEKQPSFCCFIPASQHSHRKICIFKEHQYEYVYWFVSFRSRSMSSVLVYFFICCFLFSPFAHTNTICRSEWVYDEKKIKKIRIRIYAHSTLADANVFFLVYLCESSFLHGRRNCLSVMSPRRPSLLSYSILENTELSVFQSNLCMEIKCRKICCLSPIQINN